MTVEQRKAILQKVEDDDLYEKEGAYAGQLDYMKNFLLHYIPNEKKLHDIVYPNWEDCADKFQRFATSGIGTSPSTLAIALLLILILML